MLAPRAKEVEAATTLRRAEAGTAVASFITLARNLLRLRRVALLVLRRVAGKTFPACVSKAGRPPSLSSTAKKSDRASSGTDGLAAFVAGCLERASTVAGIASELSAPSGADLAQAIRGAAGLPGHQ